MITSCLFAGRVTVAIFGCLMAILIFGVNEVSARSQTSPYCANFRNGSRDCSFPTRQACLATIHGVGGSCVHNPFSPANPPRPNFWQRMTDPGRSPPSRSPANTSRSLVLGTYCAFTTDGGTNCGFPTMQACRTAISGVGGTCRRYTQ
jgi:hypothetical protein